MLDGDLEAFVSKISWELSNSRNRSIKVIVSPLALLLKSEPARLVFGQHGGVGYLTKLLKLQGSHANAQLLYELTFCIWTLTFHEELKQGACVRASLRHCVDNPSHGCMGVRMANDKSRDPSINELTFSFPNPPNRLDRR